MPSEAPLLKDDRRPNTPMLYQQYRYYFITIGGQHGKADNHL